MDFIFKVDPIRRSIKVPDAFTVLTMDHNIHKLVFVCPYYEDFAFDSASIVFMIDAPDGRQYSIPAEEYESFPNSPSPYVKFTLTLKSYITSVVGYMSFCITADIISSGNVIEKSWHSKNITISIGGHINNDDSEDIPEEDVPTINQRLNNLDSKVGRLQTTVNGMANGTPPTASSTSEMDPDESTLYINTTDGNWYYYDGSAWQIGGQYGGATTDTTFTQSGVPADSKAVGDALADKADADDVGDLSQLTTTAKNNLVSAVTEINGRLTEYDNLIYNVNPNANGEFIFPLRTDGYWEISDGSAAFHKVSNAKFVSNRFPISVKAGDTIHIKDGINVRFFALFSADGETWTSLTSTKNSDKAIAADGFVLVSVRKEPNTLSFSDDDVRLFFEKYLTIYRRNYSNALVEAKNNIDNVAGIIVNDISYRQGYVTSSESTTQINMQIPANAPCTYGETIYISAKLGVTHPEYYGSIALSVREKNSSSGTIKVTNYTDLSNTIEYVVGKEATISLDFVITLTKQSTDSVSVGFYENVDYSLCVYKPIKSGDDISDVMTESGDTWEV